MAARMEALVPLGRNGPAGQRACDNSRRLVGSFTLLTDLGALAGCNPLASRLHDTFFREPRPEGSPDLLPFSDAVPFLHDLQGLSKLRIDHETVDTFRCHSRDSI